MKRILFVYPNVQKQAIAPQIGLCMLSSICKEAGHVCSLFDTTFVKDGDEINEFKRVIKKYEPDIVAFSIRSNDYRLAKLLVSSISNDRIITVAGGPHATIVPEEVIADFKIVVRGEGELAFKELLDKLDKGDDIVKTMNLYIKKDGNIYRNPLRMLGDIEKLPIPDWSLFTIRHYKNHFITQLKKGSRIGGSFEGSRGCLFRCTYCSNEYFRDLYKKQIWRREKSASKITDEIIEFKKCYGLDYIYFVDEIFLTNKKRLVKIRDEFKEKINIPFSIMERPELINEDKIRIAKEAGLHNICIGIESGDEEFRRKYLGRFTPQKKIIDSFKISKKYGVQTYAFNMVGLPHQDKKNLKKTYNTLQETKPDGLQVTIFYPLKGTRLYSYCKEKDYLISDDMPNNYYNTSVLILPDTSVQEIILYRKLLDKYARRYSLGYKILFNIFFTFPKLFECEQKIEKVIGSIKFWIKEFGILGSFKRWLKK